MSEKELKQQMDDMRSFDEPMPQVGIFWYDLEEKTLFGVRKQEITPKRIEDLASQGVYLIEYDYPSKKDGENFLEGPFPMGESGDRGFLLGRVAWNIDKFVVFVGQWAKPIEDELATLIEEEFALPYFEFVFEPTNER